MNMELVVAMICLATLRLSEAAVPVITGGNTQTKTVNEDVANGATAFTLTADINSFYTLSGTDAGSFTVSPTTGGVAGATCTVSITTSPVYTTKSSYSLNVIAADGSTPADTVTVAVTLNVIQTPTFGAAFTYVCLGDGTGASTTVYTSSVSAGTGLTLTYSIASGNTDTDFAFSSTGVLTVANALSTSRTASYSVVLRAVDSGTTAQTGETTVGITVGGCSGASMITGSGLAVLCLLLSKKLF